LRPTLLIGSKERLVSDVTFSKGINEAGTFSATLKSGATPQNFEKTEITLGKHSFLGRVETPSSGFSAQGSSLKVQGYGWLKRLQDYVTPSSTLTSVALAIALGEILVDSPFTLGTVDDFTTLNDLDTAPADIFEALGLTLNEVCPHFLNTVDTTATALTGTATLPLPEYRSSFWDGGRFFIFYANAAHKVCFVSSADGTTWAAETDTGYTASSDYFSVQLYSGVVYLFFYDGANTDLYTGAIAGGAIAWTLKKNNAFAGWISCQPCWNPSGYLFASVADVLYWSSDQGATWSSDSWAGDVIRAISPEDTGDDIYIFLEDTGDHDLVTETWDADSESILPATTTYSYFSDTFRLVTARMLSGTGYLLASESSDDSFHLYSFTHWGHLYSVSLPSAKTLGDYHQITLCVTNSGQVLVLIIANDNKIYYTDPASPSTGWVELTGLTVSNTSRVTSPQTGTFDGQLAPFFVIQDTSSDLHFSILAIRGLRSYTIEGSTLTNPYIQTANITGSGGFDSWGSIYTSYYGASTGATLTVLDSGGATLKSGLSTPADLDAEGITDATIAFKFVYGTTQVNELTEYRITERIAPIDLAVDYHTCWQALKSQILDTIGAEVDLHEDLTLDVLDSIGEDKSDTVILRAAGTRNHRDVKPNIIAVELQEDLASWGNCLKYIGGGSPRVEVEIRDEDSIAAQAVIEGGGGEHWRVIRDSEKTTTSQGASAASIQFDAIKTRRRKVRATFLDLEIAEEIDVGDTVTLCFYSKISKEEVNEAFRIYRLTPSWSETGGTVITAELGGRGRSSSLGRYIADIDTLKRWVT
jgi:hypothetical protein